MNKVTCVKNGNYKAISNKIFRDKNLSLKAKGMLALVLTLPDDWDFSIAGISTIIKEGKTAVYGAIDELKEYGYCSVQQLRNEKGIIVGNDYTFYEAPCVEKPCTENPNMDNQPQQNNNITTDNNNIISNKQSKEDNKEKELKEKEVADFVEHIYKMYPTRCPKRNVSLGKSAKDKERIKRLLKIYKQEDIENVVKREVEEKYGKTYMQNFSTFLNNFPDPNSLFSEEQLDNSSANDEVLLKRFYEILSVNEEAQIYGINEYEFSILNEQQRNYIRNQYRSKMLEWIKSQNR